MRRTHTVRSGLLALALLSSTACSDGTGPTAPVPNFVRLQSDPEDYIGAGRTYNYTQANASIAVSAIGNHLSIDVEGDEGWNGLFQLPGTLTRLQPGTYAALTRFPFHEQDAGGLSWSGEGRGCNTLSGSLTIESVKYAGDTLKAIDLHFEQYCEGGDAALRGTVHWRYDDANAPPGPAAIPANLWQPPAGSTPATGDYLYMASDEGDFIGRGETRLLTDADSTISVQAHAGGAFIEAEGWHGQFVPMASLNRLVVGYYDGLLRWPFHNPAKGGLSFSGNGRGCNRLDGWFAVDRVTYVNGAITELELRFEQHCEGFTPALRGKLRWSA